MTRYYSIAPTSGPHFFWIYVKAYKQLRCLKRRAPTTFLRTTFEELAVWLRVVSACHCFLGVAALAIQSEVQRLTRCSRSMPGKYVSNWNCLGKLCMHVTGSGRVQDWFGSDVPQHNIVFAFCLAQPFLLIGRVKPTHRTVPRCRRELRSRIGTWRPLDPRR